MFKKKSFWMLLLSLIGIIDAAYLTYVHFNLDRSGCAIDGGCNAVLTSSYSEFMGIPLAFFGLLYYLAIFGGTLLYKKSRDKKLFKLVKRLTIVGFVTSLYLVYIQLQILDSICPFCMTSAVTSTLLFVIGYSDLFKKVLK